MPRLPKDQITGADPRAERAPDRQHPGRDVPPPGPAAFALPPLAAREHWIWLRSGWRDRAAALRAAGDGELSLYAQHRLAWEEDAFRRTIRGYEHAFAEGEERGHTRREYWPTRLCNGLDPMGVAVLSRYLEQQVRYLEAAPGGIDPGEALVRAGVLRATSARFHQLVGATEEVVRAWARAHRPPGYPDGRTAKWNVSEHGTTSCVMRFGVRQKDDIENEADERWQRVLCDWVRQYDEPRFASVRTVEERPRPAGGPRHGWQFGFYSQYEEQLHGVEHLVPGGQYHPRMLAAPDEPERRILERFLALFPESEEGIRFHRLHAKLSAPPGPERLAEFARWLREGCAPGVPIDGPQDRTGRAFAWAWQQLKACTGDRAGLGGADGPD